MRHMPSGFVGDAEHPMDLMAGNALLRGAHEVDGRDPFGEGDMGSLENGALSDREGLAAILAVVEAGAGGLALHQGDALAIAKLAGRTVGPADRFQYFAGSVFGQVKQGVFPTP